MTEKKHQRPQRRKSGGGNKARRQPGKGTKPALGRETTPLNDSLRSYLRAAAAVGDVTLEDAQERLHSLDGSDIGILMDDFYTGSDMLYQEVSEELEALIERAGDRTPIPDVLPGG